jgi:membrane protein YqaA with SNARE-associated domain
MRSALLAVYAIASKLGGFGLLLVGLFDSSFLFMPLGNDLLMLGLTANHPRRLLYYAAMATAGSVAGCFLTDVIARKGGEEGLKRLLSPGQIEYLKRRVSNNSGWPIAVAAIMPPPFPFTAVVAGAAALQFPRKKMFTILAIMRFVRFAGIGLLSIFFGRQILDIAESPVVEYGVLGLIVVTIVGSIVSIYKWTHSRRRPVEA